MADEEAAHIKLLEGKVQVLEAKKAILFQRVQRLFDYSKDLTSRSNVGNFNLYYDSLESTRNQFAETVEQVNHLKVQINDEFVPDFQSLDVIDQMYCHIKQAAKLLPSKSESTNASEERSQTHLKAAPRLPKIDLIEFSGSLQQWPIFYETFKSLIHENAELDDVCKMQYLLGKLRGKALALCSGVAPIAANYNIVWKTLVDRYQDKRSLASNYLKQILDFKPAHLESAEYLNFFLERFNTSVSALKELKLSDLADFILYYLAFSKLDSQTQRSFEMQEQEVDIPKYGDLLDFVKRQAKILCHTSKSVSASACNSTSKQRSSHVLVNTEKTKLNDQVIRCPMCKERHTIYKCSNFLKLAPVERYNLARGKLLCLNCLSSTHKIAACRSQNKCSVCKAKHHSLLHFQRTMDSSNENTSSLDSSKASVPVQFSSTNEESAICSTSLNKSKCQSYTTLLSTAIVNVILSSGDIKPVRVLLDSGSQTNFLTYSCCRRLNLSVRKMYSSVIGIGSNKNVIKGQVQNIVISSRLDSSSQFCIDALVVNKITENLPTSTIQTQKLDYLLNLPLADPEFYKSREVDGILGAELFLQLLGTHKLVNSSDMPMALQTSLGYIVMGKAPTSMTMEGTNHFSFCSVVEPPLEKLVQNFFDLEEVPTCIIQGPDDLACENHFKSTHQRGLDGRYTVALPFKDDPSMLGDSYAVAIRRFLSIEKRLTSLPQFREKYNDVIQDYLDQGHIHKVARDASASPAYYIPHHAVTKLDSSSTPVRIVFDASAKTSTSLSLNDILYTGPKLQADICSMFLNFRIFPVAFTADIRQMYRQINLCEEHQRFQRILWRFSPNDPLDVYELSTVAFGVKSSPFLALRTLRQLAHDEAENHSQASVVLLRDMYIDDLVSSVSDTESAKLLHSELLHLLNSGGFKLLKWSSNSKEFLDCIEENYRSLQAIDFNGESLKVLGVQWQPSSDSFFIKICIPHSRCNKRSILSLIARLFDPLGFLAPVILYAKLFIRQLWSIHLDWDADPPNSIVTQWSKFQSELTLLENFSVPRHLGFYKNSTAILVGFGDACETSYAAVVYIRTVSADGIIKVNLICAKSKVSPLRVQSIPRLELCASLLLAKLIDFVVNSYRDRCNFSKIFAFSDSMVVLHWLNSSPHRWKTFVANRVTKIHSYVPQNAWYHVDGKNNSADCLSRGTMPSSFLENSVQWLTGPPWLLLDTTQWPIKPITGIEYELDIPEEKVNVSSNVALNFDDPLYQFILRFSSWHKLLRSMVYILRFSRVLSLGKDINFVDLNKAEFTLIRVVQGIYFRQDIQALQRGLECSSQLRKLRPFLRDNILRVGGRLSNASLTYDHKHPILLPKGDHFVNILIDYYHRSHLHTGPYLLLSILRQKYWILSARSIVRQRVQACNFCFRFKPKPLHPLMADLPSDRVVSQVKAFVCTGIDYAGPFYITLGRRRGAKSQKAYICLFVCLATKAIHLELASSLSTAAFIDALKRFLSRRGPVKSLHSDQGTNFIGAKAQLDEVYRFIDSSEYSDSLKQELTKHQIEWHFNPPAAPHMGGIWESNIKSVKTHLYKILGSQLLSYEEFATVLTQIEALLNSRPLCLLSSDPSDPQSLTPAHFLTLTPLRTLPSLDVDVTDIPLHRLDRKQLLDNLVQSYWKRWKGEYLSSLQTRQKWNTSSSPVKVDTIVVLIQDNIPPFQWPLGVIREVFPGKDGIIRVALVRTKDGIYKRPVVKLCPLPSQ